MPDIELPRKLRKALEREAASAKLELSAHIIRKLERTTPPTEHIDPKKLERGLQKLVEYVKAVPAVKVISQDVTPDGYWWVKLDIDISHRLAWHVVQEFGFVLNYISVSERMPTVFKPVSPPPYLNGGPEEFLSWAIESTYAYVDPGVVMQTLEGRLPRPVADENSWRDQADV